MSGFDDIPREKIPWFPTIDLEKCTACKECLKFCPNGVFEWDDKANKPKVVRPYNCVVGCSGCANICTEEAIKFPSTKELRAAINSARRVKIS